MVWRKAWGSTWMAGNTAQVDSPRGRTRLHGASKLFQVEMGFFRKKERQSQVLN